MNTFSFSLTLDKRKAILNREINKYVRQGWRVISRTDTSAQLVRDKRAGCLPTLILALFFLIPAILYLLLYKGSEGLYIEVDEEGKVYITQS